MSSFEAEELLRDFQRLTHLNVALFDRQFRCVYNLASYAPYCAAIHRSKACLDRCVRSDSHSLEQAKQTRLPQRYLCPYGLWEGIYPILDGEQILGYLFAGPVLVGDKDSLLPALYRLVRDDAPELSEETLSEGAKWLVGVSSETLSSVDRYLSLLATHIAANRLIPSDRQTLGDLIQQHIRKNLAHKITLTDISRRLHCSTVTLTETFRREFGMTIMQYVLEERLKLARQLLGTTALSVGAIAERCGFPDVEYFSRCFKQKEGISPSVWRRTHP